MKLANQHILRALNVLGAGINSVHEITLHLSNGRCIRAASVRATDLTTVYGKIAGSPSQSFMVPADELVAIEVEWNDPPKGVTDIPSAIAYEKSKVKVKA